MLLDLGLIYLFKQVLISYTSAKPLMKYQKLHDDGSHHFICKGKRGPKLSLLVMMHESGDN